MLGHRHSEHCTNLPTFKFQKEGQMRENVRKRGTFLNFLYITFYRQSFVKRGTHGKITPFFLLKKKKWDVPLKEGQLAGIAHQFLANKSVTLTSLHPL